MALHPCPECQNDISEKATSFPHCGAKWAGLCPECNHFREPSATKCGKCGFPYSSATRIREKVQKIGVSDDGLGKRWFSFWVYVCYPISVVMAGFLTFGTGKPYFAILGVFLLGVAIGLHKRQLWAWQANWVVLIGNFGALFLPAYSELVPSDTWTIQLVFHVGFLVANWFYWDKRKVWFKQGAGQMRIW